MDVMLKAFKSRTKVMAREWGHKLLIFTFIDEKDRDWVIRNQPWHFDGILFVVKSLDRSEQPSSLRITQGSFWTRAYDLSLLCQTETTLISIATRVGDLEVFEPPDGLNLGNYLRFKVSIAVNKPLIKGFKIRIKGEERWIPIKYESLPYYYFCCGLIGYNFKACEHYERNDCPEPVEMDFGLVLKASPLKKKTREGLSFPSHQPIVTHSTSAHNLIQASTRLPETSSYQNPTPRPPQSVSNPTEHPSIQTLVEPSVINSVSNSFSANMLVSQRNQCREPQEYFEAKSGVVTNPNKKTWKRSAREKGKEVATVDSSKYIFASGKRGPDVMGDLIEIEDVGFCPKCGRNLIMLEGKEKVDFST
ncbi:hypothetical protein ACS0TY_029997 [Phlomoides rotata]